MSFKVLIVDDSKLARMSVIRSLSKLKPDYTYVEASNPDEAIEALKSQPAQLAVIDFNMPVRDGLSLAAELRVIDPGMPIALVSANTQQEILLQAKNLGIRFLEKPLAMEDLESFLTEAAAQLGS